MKSSAFISKFVVRLGLIGFVALVGAGCSAMTPGNTEAVKPVSTTARAGNAYILRGWIGVFSTGVDQLGVEINKTGVNANVFQDDQWSDLASNIRKNYKPFAVREPLVLIGHSYGADDVVRIARELNKDNIQVDLLLTLDPVTPPEVPGNVVHCVNLYQSNGMWDKLPVLRGVPLAKEKGAEKTNLENLNIRVDRTDLLEPGVDHFNIEKKQKIHEEVIKQVLASCPPRGDWQLAQAAPNIAPSAGTASIAGAIPAAATIKPTYNSSPQAAFNENAPPAKHANAH